MAIILFTMDFHATHLDIKHCLHYFGDLQLFSLKIKCNLNKREVG